MVDPNNPYAVTDEEVEAFVSAHTPDTEGLTLGLKERIEHVETTLKHLATRLLTAALNKPMQEGVRKEIKTFLSKKKELLAIAEKFGVKLK